MPRLTQPQQAILETFKQYDFCQILCFADLATQKLRYALQFRNKEDTDPNYTYPNARTVDALIDKGILVETDNGAFYLNESEADNE